MKVRKMKKKKNPHASGQLCDMIAALTTAREISASVEDAAEFQGRCVDAILALGNQLLDDVSNFKAEFDGADVLDSENADDVEVVKGDLDHLTECLYARDIAALSTKELDGEAAANAVAAAVVNCKGHPVVCEGDGRLSFSYCNEYGPTCTVDDVLERMSLRDWRMACDEFCKLLLRRGGFDPEDFDWPTPVPHVTKVPEEEGTDVTARVCITFKVDERTYNHILQVVDREGESEEDEDAPATEEETCTNCDHVIRYVHEDGKRVVTCPECGTINPLCNECNPDTKKCSECKVSKMCEELNKQRADALPKPEEE